MYIQAYHSSTCGSSRAAPKERYQHAQLLKAQEEYQMFQWDEVKRAIALKTHGIDFIDAAEIFFAPHLILPGRSEIEERKRAIAPLGSRMICVVFTVRGDNIRIITARVARKNERQKYQELLSRRNPGDEGRDQLEGPHQ
jgi:uncharacterized DUF497 family protein